MVIHHIFDAWHYEVLWPYALTRILWYSEDVVHWILYITLYKTWKKDARYTWLNALMHPLKHISDCIPTLDCTPLQIPSLVNYTLPIALDGTLSACLAHALKQALKTLLSALQVGSQVHLRVSSAVHAQPRIQACSHFHLMAHSHPVLIYATGQLPKTLLSKLPSMLSSTLLLPLDDTLPEYLALSSYIHSPEAGSVELGLF